LDKVSLKDFVMDDDFGYDDLIRVAILYVKRLKLGLRWWKDSWTEAIAIKDSSEASANMGNLGGHYLLSHSKALLTSVDDRKPCQDFGWLDLQQRPRYSCTE
jgi:hypothetical protein